MIARLWEEEEDDVEVVVVVVVVMAMATVMGEVMGMGLRHGG